MTVARAAARYAKAYVDVLGERGDLDEHRHLLNFSGQVLKNRELGAVLHHVSLAPAEKIKVIQALAAKMQIPETTLRFLTLLAQNRRLALLAALRQAVVDKVDQARGIVPVVLTTAAKLDDAELGRFKESMAANLGHEVRVTTEVAPEILGGAVARAGSRIFDGSLKGQLDRLRRELAKENT